MFEGVEITWNEEKNQQLQLVRNLSFENVLMAIESGKVLDDVKHPGVNRGHQQILVVDIEGYACGVPYVRNGNTMFLKTIYRNRDFQRAYMRSK